MKGSPVGTNQLSVLKTIMEKIGFTCGIKRGWSDRWW